MNARRMQLALLALLTVTVVGAAVWAWRWASVRSRTGARELEEGDVMPMPEGLRIDDPVDHQRQHGVPPADNDDLDDEIDRQIAASFPASDPPGGW
jgi:hypothetical protein